MTGTPPLPPPALLPHDQLRDVVRLAPLAAIDLVIRHSRDEILLGLRNNKPAKACYFVPGGMILKTSGCATPSPGSSKTRRTSPPLSKMPGCFAPMSIFYPNNRFSEPGYAPITWCSAMN